MFVKEIDAGDLFENPENNKDRIKEKQYLNGDSAYGKKIIDYMISRNKLSDTEVTKDITNNQKTIFIVSLLNSLITNCSSTSLPFTRNAFIINSIIKAEKKMSDNKLSDKEKYILSYKINTLKNINR